MSLKILHTGDVHIGKKYSKYPEFVRQKLIEARFESIDCAIELANKKDCDLFVIAGDLFESLKVAQRDIDRVQKSLEKFLGDAVLILPGNHDYYEEAMSFWEKFEKTKSDHTIVLKKSEIYSMEINQYPISVYACPCDSKHSETNRLGWIYETEMDPSKINLVLAHGALIDISPDLSKKYFAMTMAEIKQTGADVSLLGHTHISYPLEIKTRDSRIFNSGTPEPDGMDYSEDGQVWFIEVDSEKNVMAEKIKTGIFRFFDETIKVSDQIDNKEIKRRFRAYEPEKVLVRLTLSGYLEKEGYEVRNNVFNNLSEHFLYFSADDTGLQVKFRKDMIQETFTDQSLPYVFLHKLLKKTDEDTTHMAYEMLMEVKKNDN